MFTAYCLALRADDVEEAFYYAIHFDLGEAAQFSAQPLAGTPPRPRTMAFTSRAAT